VGVFPLADVHANLIILSTKFSSAARTLTVQYKVIIILLNTLKLLMNLSLQKTQIERAFS